MSSRGQKRTEAVEEFPADKRACSSLRPSSSNSSEAQTSIKTASDTADTDMETSSSASEGDMERDSVYGSCDSDHSLHDYSRHRSSSDQSKFKQVVSSLGDEVDESGQLALLTELCELLSFCSDNSLSSLIADSMSPLLVRLAMHVSNPNIMLLSIRAITYLCDVNPRSSAFLVRHDAVPALVQKLMVIEYLDVAEQSLQALEKISREQALACLQSGAIVAVLSYIDFFSTSVQRVALSTVVNICNKLSPESPSLFMDAVPILCNLLQYEDKQLVESVATCLIKIGEQVNHSSDMLDEICKHGLVEHAVHLISLNSLTTLCQPTYVGLIGLLVKLASRSTVAFKTLFELNISNTVKDMLSTYDLSHGAQSSAIVDGHQNQIHEVLKLLNALLPNITAEQQDQLKADRETFLLNHPHILEKFGVDLLIILIQVVNSGVNLFTCYGCLTIINKLVHFSTANSLQSLLQSASFSSFLAGVFTRKDNHVVLLALQIVDTIMLKLPHVFLSSFIKEGVLFSIYSLLSPDNDMKLYPVYDDLGLRKGPSKPASRNVNRCPCFSFDSSPQNGTCKLQSDTIQNLSEHIWTTYFQTESMNPEKGITDTLKKLRSLSGALMDQVNKFSNDVSSQHDDEIYRILNEIMSNLNGKDSISTFEFVQSGIIKALVNYLLNNSHPVGEEENVSASHLYVMEKRFEVFGRLLLTCADPLGQEFPLLTLIQRTQSALSSVENFPVIVSHKVKMTNSYATVPFERSTSYPCLKVQFLRENKEFYLDDYTDDVVNVDPFSPLKEIERFLWPRVSNGKTKKLALDSKDSSCSHSPSDSSTSQCNSADDTVSTETLEEEGKHDTSSPSPAATSIYEATNVGLEEEVGMDTDHPVGRDIEGTRPKLLFYLEGQQLNNEMSLYQTILDQQAVVENDDRKSPSLWNRIYKITYRKHLISQSSHAKHCDDEAQNSLLSKRASYLQYTSFISRMLVSANDLKQLGQIYDISFLLKILEEINRLRCHLISRARTCAFAEGRTESLNMLNIPVYEVCQTEFVNSKLTDKLEQQMRDPMTFTAGSMPIWCTQLMSWCPFLFGFEARHKYFHLSALGRPSVHAHITPPENVGGSNSRQQNHGIIARKKFLVHRDKILQSAAEMMKFHAHKKVLLEVEYSEEVGTGLGPTLEFYTMVCQEFQRRGLGMWRDDHAIEAGNSEFLVSPFGLFPRPWSPSLSTSSNTACSEVIAKFALLGQIVAKALQDGRILDLPFSKAFYKLVLGKEITVFDIQSIDPALARTLLEFQAIVDRKGHLRYLSEDNSQKHDLCFRNTNIEDLCLDFTLPGYPDYVLSASDSMVNLSNLEEYVTLIVDATTKSGIYKQVEAFKSGFDQVFPISHLKVFTEEELERLLCGEQVMWNSNELTEHIKFDHGYTISSPPIINFLEIMQEFDLDKQRAFLQFTTGAPRLPTGGLASLNPKLTIVRKHCSNLIDADLPSVMTCANYLKLPPYSSKSVMKEKLLYAITEGQGSFHLS